MSAVVYCSVSVIASIVNIVIIIIITALTRIASGDNAITQTHTHTFQVNSFTATEEQG
jgi:hypothetical protein